TSKLVRTACSRPAANVAATVGSMRCARRPSRNKTASSGSSSTISTRMAEGLRLPVCARQRVCGALAGSFFYVDDSRHPEPLMWGAHIDVLPRQESAVDDDVV